MGNENQVFEYDGAAVRSMSMSERMVLCNMSAELGAKTGIVTADATTLRALELAGHSFADNIERWQSDADASCLASHCFNANTLEPQIAAPHSPANSCPVTCCDKVAIHQAYIGACTGAKLSDLQMAAQVLKGRKVARGTRLLIAPASVAMTAQAAADGTLQILTEAGAILLPTGCGACAGMGAGMVAAGEVCLSTTARNFKGRMGSPESLVYLGSPYSVAAGAVKGEICDARELLAEAA
jgi:3-isopropylmalate/(R)-2-methylmalate dehydratase large subunit